MKKLLKAVLNIILFIVIFFLGFLLGDSGSEDSQNDASKYDRQNYENYEEENSLAELIDGVDSTENSSYDSEWGDDTFSSIFGWDDYNDDYSSTGEYYHYNMSEKADLFSDIGSAKEMSGNVVVVSIFADDKTTSWGENASKTKKHVLKYLGMACDYLTTNTKKYGGNVNFIYDYNVNPDIYFETKFDTNFVREREIDDYAAWEWIEKNVDCESIINKYNAGGMIFMVYINSSNNCKTLSCTRAYYEGMEYPYEVCYMYMHSEGEEESPAAFAHEMMHTFGAPDLYMADTYGENYGITQEYVDELTYTNSNDIMYTCYNVRNNYLPSYDRITNDFTELDAYYTGLTDYSKTVDEWGFNSSEH